MCDAHAQVQALRQVVNQRLLVAEPQRVPFPARLGRPEEVVEVGAVELEVAAPLLVFVLEIEVKTLVGRQARIGSVGGGHARLVEQDGVRELHAEPVCEEVLVALDDREE